MKLKKIFVGAIAGAISIGTLASSVSAGVLWTLPEGTEKDPGLSLNNGMYLVQLYNTGNEAENKPAVDYGLNVNDVGGFTVYTQIESTDEAAYPPDSLMVGTDGGFGGGFIYSANGDQLGTSATDSDVYDEATGQTYYAKYNWPNTLQWWGIPGETDTPDDPESKQGTVSYLDNNGNKMFTYQEYIDLTHYKMNCTIPEDLLWPSTDERKGNCYQIGLQEWGNDPFFLLKVNLFVVKDKSGEPMIAFDEKGTPIQDAAEIKKMVEKFETPSVIAPAETTAASTSDAVSTGDAASTGDSSAAPSSSAPTSSAAPTTTAASSSSNSSSNVGLIVAIIAIVVVIVVVVVIIVVKKKKS